MQKKSVFVKKIGKYVRILPNFGSCHDFFVTLRSKETNKNMQHTSLNIGGRLTDLSQPQVMAIINVTPDSFAVSCSSLQEDEIVRCAEKALADGADMLDIGGYSTRPGAMEVSAEEEWRRVEMALRAIRKRWPETIISVDTFRASVARQAVRQYGADIINDISGGELDSTMFQTIADLHVPYILMHMRGTPATMQQMTDYTDLMSDMLAYFQQKTDQLHRLGVRDVILDPGFGFAKTLEQNYQLLRQMSLFKQLNLPILAGLSRKSMIYKALGITPQDALNGTTALNMLALENGANILRVHDVKEAKQTITLYTHYHGTGIRN